MSTTNRARVAFILALACAPPIVAGCSDEHAEGDSHSHSHDAPFPDDCLDLINACHYKDTGDPGRINDCHTIGHAGNKQACLDAIAGGCIDDCDAAPPRDDAGSD